MKKLFIKFILRLVLRYVLGNFTKVNHAIALAEASRQGGDKPFTRRGKVYRSIKDWSPTDTPVFMLNLGAEVAQTIDELNRK